jgi:hypothetical protein
MSALKLGVAMALLLSATSAALAQEGRCLGDRPYYGSESSGWLDSNYHSGIDCDIAPANTAGAATDSRRRSLNPQAIAARVSFGRHGRAKSAYSCGFSQRANARLTL